MRRFLLFLSLAAGCAPGQGDRDTALPAVDHDGDGYDTVVDCDDVHADVNPDAAEVCDGLDNDCDGTVDDGATDATTYYADGDGDSFGDAASATAECSQPSGYVTDATDCDDAQVASFPGNPELCDGRDNDCDGTVDDDAGDVVTYWADGDSDGYGDGDAPLDACDLPVGYAETAGDCDDTDAAIHPDAAETDCTDPVDYNCDASTGYADADGDGVPAGATVAGVPSARAFKFPFLFHRWNGCNRAFTW